MSDRLKLELRRSEIRQRLGEIAGTETLTDELRTEVATLRTESADIELRYQAALTAEGEAAEHVALTHPDAEMRERIELRSKARLTEYLRCRAAGTMPTGAESELQAAAGVTEIPMELWDVPEERDIAAPPGTVGVNLDTLRPHVFATSIAPRLGIEMPRVMSGTYASATITTSQTASSLAKSGAAAGIAGAFTVTTATPKRVSARLELTLEDISAVGAGNFESVLRENLALSLSDELDKQIINGAGAGNDLTGIFQRLTNPGAPASGVETWTRFLAIQSGGIDGLWASELEHINLVAGVDTYRLAAATFQGTDAEDSAASYLKRMGGGFWTNSRMPATDSNIQQGLLYRAGRQMMGGAGAMRTAVCPHWNSVGIDDVYSGSAKGERYFTFHTVLGDVILTQPSAYAQVAYRVSV